MHKHSDPFILDVRSHFMGSHGQILIADDDPDFVVLFQIALKNAGFSNDVQVASTGAELMDYLEGRGEYADRKAHPMPALAFIDLKLPFRHGFEVLRWIRNQPELNDLIVVIMSGFSFANEAEVAHDLGANAFLAKPTRFGSLVEVLKQYREEWCPAGPTAPALPAPERESEVVAAGHDR